MTIGKSECLGPHANLTLQHAKASTGVSSDLFLTQPAIISVRMTVKAQSHTQAIHFPDPVPGERLPKIRRVSPALPVRTRLRRKVVDALSNQQAGTNEKIQANAELMRDRPGAAMNVSQTVVERYQDRALGNLNSASSLQNRRQSFQENSQIEAQRPVVDIFEILLYPILEVNRVSGVHLPQPGQSGDYAEAAQ